MSLAESRARGSCRLIKPQVLSWLSQVNSFTTARGIEAYVVGGLVRDVLLGRVVADVDITLAADALEIAPKLAGLLGGKYVLLDQVNRAARVLVRRDEATDLPGEQGEFDFTTFQGSLEQELMRRDFTIDAMAVELKQMVEFLSSSAEERGQALPKLPGLLDPLAGWDDLQRGVVRAVSDEAFAADAVRLLRAVRLAAELGFTIEERTEALMRRDAHLATGVAGERVREEVLRLLSFSDGGRFLTHLDGLGLLTAIFPELAKTKGVEQLREHFWDVFEHSLQTVRAVDFLLRHGSWEYAGGEVLPAVPWSSMLVQHFDLEVSRGSSRRVLLKLAALLHDIAKPQTKTIEAGGRVRFLGHAREGAVIAAGMLERLRFSAREIKLVEILIRHHLRPGQMGQKELPTRRAVYRYFRDTADAGIDVLFFSLADHLATRGPELNLQYWQEHARLVEYVLTQHLEQASLVRAPKLVDGHDLINLFRLSPGPKIGEILEAVKEEQASGEVTTRQEALSFVRRLLDSGEG